MTHPNPLRPASTPARALLVAGAVAGPLFLVTGVAGGLARDGFDFTRNALSQLSLGTYGWVQITAFVLAGLLAVAGAVGVRRALRGAAGGTWAPPLIAVFGVSFLVAAVFRADPGRGFPAGTPDLAPAALSAHGTVHMAAAGTGFLALCVAFLVLARHFAARGHRGWAIGCRVVPVGVVAGFAGSAAAPLAFTLGAGLGLVWLTAVTARLRATD